MSRRKRRQQKSKKRGRNNYGKSHERMRTKWK